MTMIILFILIFVTIIAFVLFSMFLPSFLRSKSLLKLATKFNLSFDRNNKFYWVTPKEYKENIIRGIINGKNIEIYDYVKPVGHKILIPFGQPPRNYTVSERKTVLIVNNNQQSLNGLFGWYAPISEIRKFLYELRESN